jgi:hypothetical protein
MTDHLTSIFIAAIAVLVIIYDVWIVWRRGGNSTVSWVLATWWIARPWAMVTVFILIGHLFFPACAPPGNAGTQSISAVLGTTIGSVGILGIVGWLVYVIHQPSEPNGPVVSQAYLSRLALLATFGVAAGHFVFTQYAVCKP